MHIKVLNAVAGQQVTGAEEEGEEDTVDDGGQEEVQHQPRRRDMARLGMARTWKAGAHGLAMAMATSHLPLSRPQRLLGKVANV